MKTSHYFSLAFPIAIAMMLGKPALGREPDPVLQGVQRALEPVLAGLNPAAVVEYPEHSKSLLVLYRPQTYLVHPRSKTGERARDVHETVGPSFTGFVLKVHLQDNDTVNQAVTPQTIAEPYWKTFLDVTPIAGTDRQIYWALSFAGRSDENLLERVRQTLWGLSGKEAGAVQGVGVEARREAGDVFALEGILKRHPKYLFKYYVAGFGDGQACALVGDDKLEPIDLGSRIRVEGRLGTRFHDGGNKDNPSPFPRTCYIYMEVERVTVLHPPAGE